MSSHLPLSLFLFNMYGLPSSYVFDHDVTGLDSLIQRTFTPSVRYVARHWARHLLRAVAAKNGGDLVCRLSVRQSTVLDRGYEFD